MNPERKSSGSQFYIVWGKPFDGATLDRIQQSVTAATNGEIVIPDSLRTIYETTGGTPFLDGQYTVFGRVTEGLEIVEAIQGVATDSVGRPLEDVRIIRGAPAGARHGADRDPRGGFRGFADDCRGADLPADEK